MESSNGFREYNQIGAVAVEHNGVNSPPVAISFCKIKVWDAQEKKCVGALIGHTGSVKSICSHPTDHDIIVSGSRDGSFALWDLRCAGSRQGKLCRTPIDVIQGAHSTTLGRRVRRGKDEVSIATAGAVDSVVKFWDRRNLKTSVAQACSDLESPTQRERRLHGIASLSQDLNGMFLSASCMDNRIYLYNILQLKRGPVKSLSGMPNWVIFCKTMSPAAAHILGSSLDGNAYIWQVNKPQADPIILKSHDGEATAVDWCSSETGKIATSSDYFTVRFWDVRSSCYSKTTSPSSIRRRVMALPSMEC